MIKGRGCGLGQLMGHTAWVTEGVWLYIARVVCKYCGAGFCLCVV